MKKISIVLAFVLLFSLFLAACESSGSGGSGAINVTMSDFKFDPATITVDAGKPVAVKVTNNGPSAHSWTVMSKPVSGSYSQADATNIVVNSDVINPGQSKTVNFTAPTTPGDYQIICTVPGHKEAGMVGHLIVK